MMPKCLFFLLVAFYTPLFSQDSPSLFKSDTSLYQYSMTIFIKAMDIKDSIWLRGDGSFDYFFPKMIEGVKIKWIYPEDYIAYLKRKKLKEVVILTPVRFYDDCFHVSVSKFKISYNKKKRLFTFVNREGIGLKFRFDCLKNGYTLISETSGI